MRSAQACTLIALLISPGLGHADFAEDMRLRCIEPLTRGEDVGAHFDPDSIRNVTASGNETGRQWQIDKGYWLSEIRTKAGLRGCQISREGAGNLDAIASGTKEEADGLWMRFARVAEDLLKRGDFVARDVQSVANMRLRAVETVGRNPGGHLVVALVAHDLNNNYAFVFAGDDQGGTQ